MKFKTDGLVQIFDKASRIGQKASIDHWEYVQAFGHNANCNAGELWKKIVEKLSVGNSALEKWKPELNVILSEGTLSDRIIKSLHGDTSAESIKRIYKQLAGCLAQNKMFVP
jgi:carboxylate-amine ligase